MRKMFEYGSKKPFNIVDGAKKGLLAIRDDPTGIYSNLVYYGRFITSKELNDSGLYYIGEVERL